jgi:branched-chain amino acid transport system ATP-binding protein
MLTVNGVSKHFGGLVALEEVSLEVREMEIVGLIGPNGSGKTTLFNLITRVFPVTKGEIRYHDKIINALKPHEVCRLGIARTHQIPRPFKNLSVKQNVVLAHLYGSADRKDKRGSKKIACDLLAMVGLADAAENPASRLNDVQCKVLELARCLATRPKLLLLDEILAGLTPSELQHFQRLILKIRDEMKIAVFWCEHIMRVIMSSADRIICLDHGKMICEGTPEVVANDEHVISCYLGKAKGEAVC